MASGNPKMLGDKFATQAILTPTESAANTLTFEKLETGVSVYDRIGWVIQRIEWRMSAATQALFNGTGDLLTMALTLTNSLTALNDDNPALIAIRKWQRTDFGTAASASIEPLTWIDDYSTLAGGGLLCLPNPIYSAVLGTGLSGAASVFIRVFFVTVQLDDKDYFNLVQARQLLISS